ncbi:MAG: class D sortase [Anaerolineae bacterium]|nr:class D sortase [Anaerolineae bacterium]
MRDKRPVDELSIEELERILAIRKREARQDRLRRMAKQGRVSLPQPPPPAAPTVMAPTPQRDALPAGEAETSPAAGPPQFVDEFSSTPQAETSTFWDMVWNRSLLALEIIAFAGLIFIGVQLVLALQTLQQETATVQAEAQAAAYASLPTPSVTPEITLSRVVLPSGHTPPTSSGGAQFNLNEIPANLRPVIQQQLAAPIAIPTPGPESPVRIQIPAINVDAPVVSGVDWEALKRGVGFLPGSGLPGQGGNMVLSAHNDIYSEIFRYLDQLQPGDEIIVHTLTQRYTYTVRESQVVSPYAVHVMDPTREPTATLISCYPYQVDNQRIVIFADLQRG